MSVLAIYDRAQRALAEALQATSVDAVMASRDDLAHIKLRARQIRDRALLADATEFQMRVERRLGVLLAAAKDAGHLREGRPAKAEPDATEPAPATLAEIGVDRKLSMKAQRAAAMTDEDFVGAVAAMRIRMASGKAILVDPIDGMSQDNKKEHRAARERDLAEVQKGLQVMSGMGWDRLPPDMALKVGKAAEHLVCADALMRGYEAFLSGQGAPYDLVIEKHGRLFRVQVKGAQGPRNINSQGNNPRIAYSFAALRRGKNGEGPRLTKQHADIMACVALDTLQIAYLPIFECSSSIQLETSAVPDNGYVRTYDRPIGEYPLEQAIAKVVAEDHYIDLRKTFPPFPKRRYGVILADPPWSFSTYSENGMDRSADNHYPTVDVATLCGVGPFIPAADDCALFLWATVPMLPEAINVMAAWGFEYKSHTTWKKDRIGTGYWFRNQHELLLVGTRGNKLPAPAMGTQFPSIIDAPVGRHSEKPDAFYELIEAYFPTLPKIELNSRRARAGWDAWGLEAQTGEGAAA